MKPEKVISDEKLHRIIQSKTPMVLSRDNIMYRFGLSVARAALDELKITRAIDMPAECGPECPAQEIDCCCMLFGLCPTKGTVLVKAKEKP